MGKKKKLSSIDLSQYSQTTHIHDDVKVHYRILIVCEGEKTEPNYFESFEEIQKGGYVFDIDCKGGKINTLTVVDKAIELRDKAEKSGKPYDSVWAVFDKDDFPEEKFNEAILKAERSGIGCAWSNEAFELWYVFHFENRITPMSRDEYKERINFNINNSPSYKGKKKYEYKKNDRNTKEILSLYGDEQRAIKFAEKQEKSFEDRSFGKHNPCTLVYKLVRLLRGEDEEFNRKIQKDMEKK